MPKLLLSHKQIYQLTGKKRNAAQVRWLCENGFYCKQRADGSVVLSRDNFNAIMNPSASNDLQQPNWDALKKLSE